MLQYLHEILILLGPERRRLPKMVLLFLVTSMLDIAGLGLIGPYVALIATPGTPSEVLGPVVIWLGLPSDPEHLLTLMSCCLIGIFGFKTAAGIWVNNAIARFSMAQQGRLSTFLMQTYQALPYINYLSRNSSEYIHSTQSLTVEFANNVVSNGMRTLSDIIVSLAILGLLAWNNAPALVLLVGLLSFMIFSYDRLFRRRIRVYGTRANQAARHMVQGIHEGIEGLKEIRILGREGHFLGIVRESAEEFGRNKVRASTIAIAPRYLIEFSLVLFIVCLVLITLSNQGNLQQLMPTFGIFGLAALRLMPAAYGLSSSLIKFRYSRDTVSRLYRDVTTLQANLREASTNPTVEAEPFQNLALDQVHFRYPNTDRDALHNLTLEIRAGESIGLIGASGSGKTTLVDVFLGLLEPQTGKILFNGKPLIDNISNWRSQVAYLPQQVFLIDDTLRRNIALGVTEEKIDDSRIQEALHQSRLTELVKQLPRGVETQLGERGVRLSGGQRQRVALARAFYHNRDVLVMDEATSALDNETEHEIVEEIQHLRDKKTIIVIAHRLTTVQHCTRIYKLENGHIVESGPPNEVLSQT